MRVSFPRPSRLLALALALTIVAAACHDGATPFEVYGPTSATFSIAVGETIDIHMQSVGPGDFTAPPTLSSSAINYLGVGPGPIDPGGITQVFHFAGATQGQTIITFQRVCECSPPIAELNYTVTDTVIVH